MTTSNQHVFSRTGTPSRDWPNAMAYPGTLQFHHTFTGESLTMKTILALLALSASTAASAACYMIYSPTNELVWRGPNPPVRMDAPSLTDEVRKTVPNGHLVINSEPFASCPPLDVTAPRTAMQQGEDTAPGNKASSTRK